MEPREVVLSWVEAFKRGDVDALAELCGEGAIHHQVTEDPVVGRRVIRQMFADGFATGEVVPSPPAREDR